MLRFIKVLLYPFSILYGLLMLLRNKMFDWGILPSHSFDIPVIGVGNLSLGGTGKTPHVEYLIRLLHPQFKVAILSRGYGRRTKGFLLAEINMSTSFIGDEVRQYKNKFPELIVAVCEKRVKGIKKLTSLYPDLDVIILDDAYQHRYVKPGLNILLTGYSNLYTDSFVVPTGRLREFISGASRAHIICVTKAPKVLSPIVVKEYEKKLKPEKHQQLIFTYLHYKNLIPLYEGAGDNMPEKVYAILMLTGIANPYPLEEHLKQKCTELFKMEYKDHHNYSLKDTDTILKTFNNIYSVNKIIVTTEKDAKRLERPQFREKFKNTPIFYVPIEVDIHKPYKKEFDNKILNYVRANKKNS